MKAFTWHPAWWYQPIFGVFIKKVFKCPVNRARNRPPTVHQWVFSSCNSHITQRPLLAFFFVRNYWEVIGQINLQFSHKVTLIVLLWTFPVCNTCDTQCPLVAIFIFKFVAVLIQTALNNEQQYISRHWLSQVGSKMSILPPCVWSDGFSLVSLEPILHTGKPW